MFRKFTGPHMVVEVELACSLHLGSDYPELSKGKGSEGRAYIGLRVFVAEFISTKKCTLSVL